MATRLAVLASGTWSQVDNGGNVPPVNEADVSDGGLTFTDGGGQLPADLRQCLGA